MKSTTNLPDPRPMDPQADATTMEVQYLLPVLEQLPAPWRTAVDVGAHRGDVTAYLASMGYRVLAVEPHPQMAGRLEQRFTGLISRGAVRVARCAASERNGEDADFFVGSATTVNTLEEEWTTRGFPEHFGRRQTIRVPLRRVDDLARGFTRERLGFLKVDVEGHEYPCLRGCFSSGSMMRPAVVMFEAFSRFPGAAEQCLLYLARQGYGTFDIFVRVGQELTALERFRKPGLPEAWRERQGTLFYANVIAYHAAASDSIALPEPGEFFEEYRQALGSGIRAAA
jgi:FkbM family methyltransferase